MRFYQISNESLTSIPKNISFDQCFDQACKLYSKIEKEGLNPTLYQVANYKGDSESADSRWSKLPKHVWQHYVVVVNDTVLDPTAKQFGVDKPTKYSVDQLKNDWVDMYKVDPERISESLTSALPYKQKVKKVFGVEDPENKIYQFTINDIRYDVRFNSDNKGKDWEFVFTANTPKGGIFYVKTHTGHQQQVFASVINILRDFIKKVQPNSVSFSADKDEESRVRLYNALVRKFRPELQRMGYEANLAGGSNDYANYRIEKLRKEPESVNELKKYAHTGHGYQDTDPSVIPRKPWQGPHERKELAMMLDGVKPAALINDLQISAFDPYLKQGRFIGKALSGHQKGNYIIAQPNEQWRLNKIAEIISNFELSRDDLDRYHAKLGRLLGYDKEHIKKFIVGR